MAIVDELPSQDEQGMVEYTVLYCVIVSCVSGVDVTGTGGVYVGGGVVVSTGATGEDDENSRLLSVFSVRGGSNVAEVVVGHIDVVV